MKFLIKVIVIIFCIGNLGFAKSEESQKKIDDIIKEQDKLAEIHPEGGFIPSETVANEIAKAILKPILKEDLKKELPLEIKKKENIWIIQGKKRSKCLSSDKNCYSFDQTPVYLELSSIDGRVIKVIKYK